MKTPWPLWPFLSAEPRAGRPLPLVLAVLVGTAGAWELPASTLPAALEQEALAQEVPAALSLAGPASHHPAVEASAPESSAADGSDVASAAPGTEGSAPEVLGTHVGTHGSQEPAALAELVDGAALAPEETSGCISLPDLPPLPVQVRLPASSGEAVIKVDAQGQVFVRSEDAALFSLPQPCPAQRYQALPWPAQFDAASLILTVTPSAAFYGERVENAAVRSPGQDAGMVGVQTSSTLTATPAGYGLQTSLAVQAQAQSGDLSVHAALNVDARALLAPKDAQVQGVNTLRAEAPAAYVAWRRGEQQWQAGLVGVGRPLLGAALIHDTGSSQRTSVRAESASGGYYTLRLGEAVLRQGFLEPGITELDELVLPPGEGTLTLTIEETGGRRVLTLPYRAAAAVPPGTLRYRVAAGVTPARTALILGREVPAPQDVRPALDSEVRYQLSREVALLGRAALGPDPAVSLSVSAQPRPGLGASVTAGASANSGTGVTTLNGAAGVSGQAAWGSWSGAVGVSRRQEAQTGLTEFGSDLTIAATVDTLSLNAGLSTQGGRSRASVGLGGRFAQGSWTVQGQLEPGKARVNLGLTLFPEDGGNGQVTTGVQGGQLQLAGRLPLDTLAWTAPRRLPPMQARVSARVLPTPGVQLDVTGPVNGSLALSAGSGVYGQGALGAVIAGAPEGQVPVVPPLLNLGLNTRIGFSGGQSTLMASGLGRLLEVRVGVPGVRVTAEGQSAWSGADGRALVAVPGRELGPTVTVRIDEQSLPISASFSRLSLRIGGDPGALAWQADFTPYLERSPLRRLTGPTFPPGSEARLGTASSPVSATGYFVLEARPGDLIEVRWLGGSCAATYTLFEELPCR